MDEKDKILAVVRKYNLFFENNDADILFSVKGAYYYYEYNKKYKHFEAFIEFKNAEELERIVASTVMDELDTVLAVIGENVNEKFEDIAVDDARTEYHEGYNFIAASNKLKLIAEQFEKMGSWLSWICESLAVVAKDLQANYK